MRPPITVNLLLYFLQMRAAYGERRAVFQDGHAVFYLHNMYYVDNTSPVDVDKLFRA